MFVSGHEGLVLKLDVGLSVDPPITLLEGGPKSVHQVCQGFVLKDGSQIATAAIN
jgi:hypothetical protein